MVSFDGIKRNANIPPAAKPAPLRGFPPPRVRVVHRRLVRRAKSAQPVRGSAKRFISLLRHAQHQTIMAAVTLLVLASFSGGMWFAETTPRISAEQFATTAAATDSFSSRPIILATVTPENLKPPEVGNDVLFSTPLEDLQEYMSAVNSKPTATSTVDELMAQRKEQLKAYLKDMRSPFLSEVDTIAEQPHWKLILAISFAESTLGKRCYMYNCSGIGGSNIKTYDSLQSWIVDFNGLLEKRYKEKTLEQMCGVYVQPCNPNWLVATKQVLTDLKERGIE